MSRAEREDCQRRLERTGPVTCFPTRMGQATEGDGQRLQPGGSGVRTFGEPMLLKRERLWAKVGPRFSLPPPEIPRLSSQKKLPDPSVLHNLGIGDDPTQFGGWKYQKLALLSCQRCAKPSR